MKLSKQDCANLLDASKTHIYSKSFILFSRMFKTILFYNINYEDISIFHLVD